MGISGHVTIVSFKSKYIAVAVIGAVVVSLAVGFVLVFENRSQHAALLDTAAADARSRVLGELTLRASELARHVSERVDDGVLRGDRDAVIAQLEVFKRDNTLLGVVVRNTAGRELYAWRRAGDAAGRCVPTCRPCRVSKFRKPWAKWQSRCARSSPHPIRPQRAPISIRCSAGSYAGR